MRAPGLSIERRINMPPKRLEDVVSELAATYPVDQAVALARYEIEDREYTKEKQREALGYMQKTANKSAQGLREAVKTLLAREMDIDEVVETLGVSKNRVIDCIVYYDLEEFIQPGKRKEEWRKGLPCGLDTDREREGFKHVVKRMAEYHFHHLRNKGWHLHFDDVLGEVCEVYLKCAKGYQDREGGAQFKTYLDKAVTNHFITWQKKAMMEAEIMEPLDDEKVYGGTYPIKVNGKYVAA
jgi:hypothetical protein